jgi:hypothetical protein
MGTWHATHIVCPIRVDGSCVRKQVARMNEVICGMGTNQNPDIASLIRTTLFLLRSIFQDDS